MEVNDSYFEDDTDDHNDDFDMYEDADSDGEQMLRPANREFEEHENDENEDFELLNSFKVE